jgi:hypothetical protein
MVSQILDAALATLKDPLLIHAAEESAFLKETNDAAMANAEIAFGKSGESARPMDSDRALQAPSGMTTARSLDEVSDSSSQSV